MTVKTLENGFKIYIMKKHGFIEKQAMLAVRFGSDISLFSTEKGEYSLPLGTAHFIEHKMFASQDGNFMADFSKNGAEANAFTSFDITAYYFTCRKNFYENLSLLLKMLSTPYFTENGIQSERGIIEKEINMYRDDIRWKCFFALLRRMYADMSVSSFIAGTEKEIAKITPEIMYNCYYSFYTPDRMALIVAGDVDEDKICETAAEHLKLRQNKGVKILCDAKKSLIKENTKDVYIDADIKQPLFYCGLKYPSGNITAESVIKTKLFLELLAGDCSALYESLLNNGLTEEPLSYEYLKGGYYNACFISGTTNSPEAVKNEITEHLYKLNENDTTLAVKKLKGKLIMQQDNISSICQTVADCFAKNIDYLDILNLYDKMDKEMNFSFDGPEDVFMSVIGGKR